jgi:multiple sugar transport system ATP-binding protein
MATITLKNIAGLDLSLGNREFVGLTGPAGCRASAILRMIAGLDEIAQGDVLVDDRRLNDVPPNERDVAFVSNGHAPYPSMSVYENIAVGLKNRKFAETEIRKRVTSVAEILGLTPKLEGRSGSLSDEERQRVALARAMVRQPKIYLFDEPFAGLPPDARARGRGEVMKLHQRSSATVIYATHDPLEALALAARTVVMDAGVIQQDAPAHAVYDEPANLFVAKFFGEPPMNLIHGTLKQERDAVTFSEAGDGTIAVALPAAGSPGAGELAGKSVVLGVRPEEIEIVPAAEGAGRPATGFRGLVERAEPVANETVLFVQTGAHELICRSRRWSGQGDAGHRFQFEIQLGKARLFDPVSGRRIVAEP